MFQPPFLCVRVSCWNVELRTNCLIFVSLSLCVCVWTCHDAISEKVGCVCWARGPRGGEKNDLPPSFFCFDFPRCLLSVFSSSSSSLKRWKKKKKKKKKKEKRARLLVPLWVCVICHPFFLLLLFFFLTVKRVWLASSICCCCCVHTYVRSREREREPTKRAPLSDKPLLARESRRVFIFFGKEKFEMGRSVRDAERVEGRARTFTHSKRHELNCCVCFSISLFPYNYSIPLYSVHCSRLYCCCHRRMTLKRRRREGGGRLIASFVELPIPFGLLGNWTGRRRWRRKEKAIENRLAIVSSTWWPVGGVGEGGGGGGGEINARDWMSKLRRTSNGKSTHSNKKVDIRAHV